MVEEKLADLLLSQYHIYLLLGIVSILYTLKQIPPINNFLFSDKWRWLIGPINLALSSIGIFVLKLTDVQGFGSHLMIMLTISAFGTFAYELIIKHFDQMLRDKFSKSDPPTALPTGSPPVIP